jgi:hypothetical protein
MYCPQIAPFSLAASATLTAILQHFLHKGNPLFFGVTEIDDHEWLQSLFTIDSPWRTIFSNLAS